MSPLTLKSSETLKPHHPETLNPPKKSLESLITTSATMAPSAASLRQLKTHARKKRLSDISAFCKGLGFRVWGKDSWSRISNHQTGSSRKPETPNPFIQACFVRRAQKTTTYRISFTYAMLRTSRKPRNPSYRNPKALVTPYNNPLQYPV